MFQAPDLYFKTALSFCAELNSYEPTSENEVFEFDFDRVKNCGPFPMLMVSNAIRYKCEKIKIISLMPLTVITIMQGIRSFIVHVD